MRKLLLSFLLLFFLFPSISSAEEDFPFVGRITGNRLNARVGTGANSVVVKQLDKGSLVLVLKEEQGWYFIEPPEGTSFWIYSSLIRDGWPKSDGINVRSGAGTHYPVVCQVDRNSSLDILSEKAEWTQISPPQGSSVVVNKEYVTYFSAPENYALKLEEEKLSKELFEQAEVFRKQELSQKMADIDFNAVLEKYQSIQERFPGSPMTDKVEARIKDTEAKINVAEREIRAMELRKKRAAVRIPKKTETIALTKKETIKKQVAIPVKKKQIVQKREPVLLSFEGLLRPVRGQNQQLFTHQLQGGFLNTRRLCLLSAPKLDLSSYHNKKVRVWGQFVAAEVEGVSGIRVERLELAR